MKSTDGLSRRVERLEGERRSDRAACASASVEEAEEGRVHRQYVEHLQRPEWPAWPADKDRDYHRWVRAHWTVEASDEFDLHLERELALLPVECRELCFRLLDERDDVGAVREALRERDYPAPPAEYAGDWWQWYSTWPPVPLTSLSRDQADFLGDMFHCVKARATWRPDAYEDHRTSDRRRFNEKWERPHDDLLADLRERRVCGIRGRYRLTGIWGEAESGITGADIDAP